MKTLERCRAICMGFLISAQITTIAMADPTSIAEPQQHVPPFSEQSRTDLQPRLLSGTFTDRRAEMRAEMRAEQEALGEGQDQVAPPLANLPIIDAKLATKARAVPMSDSLRVIIHLDYLPHAEVFASVTSRYQDEFDALEKDRQAFAEVQKAKRSSIAEIDAENYSSMFDMSDDDKQQLREMGERNEALSVRVKDEANSALKTLLDANQAPVVNQIGLLGGNVEFTMIAANTIVATVPASRIAELAKIPGVLRVVEDSIMEGHLNNADSATMVDPSNASLVGLWDAGATGSIYDPAVIDSGIDLSHPGMQNSAARDNFTSWFVVAGVGSASYDEQCCSIDDLHGHGTAVSGIVGSYGTGIYPDHLGMAYGVEKFVHLKAGWLNTSGRVSMFWSDKYNVVDRALYDTDGLHPASSFLDDVDGMNLSFGGATTLDDTDGGRFWDSVIATYPDLPVTVSVGNSGPANTIFQDPAVSYNAIAVASYDDRNTASLDDDIVSSTSTRGPTAAGRRKPDIAAPGAAISAPNTFWETQLDYTEGSGSSFAPPMVLGVIMDLMDAAVFDEKVIKALLINTAQKNRPGMDIEGDFDGWDPALGWGAMNAYAAYFHRFDYFIDSVTPNGNDGDYQLYKGTMRDEGSTGEGRDRVTMVWNRPATYNTAAAPTTYYSLSDLNLRLYDESDNFLIDSDLDFDDNVHQVRVRAGADETTVVVNAYAWSSNFAHGGDSESFALATEDGFTRVDHPTTFQGIAVWPSSVEPNEVFDIEFWLRNDSELASHNNSFDLELPAGWTLIAGSDTQDVGSAAGGGGNTAHVFYTIRAGVNQGAANIQVKHSHNSYNEPYGDFNWNMGTTVEWDYTAPNPDPMSFSTPPFDVTNASISMTASFASDAAHNPVEYYLDYTSSPTSGLGGTDSGWQASRSYTDLFLQTNHNYCYRAWARDNATVENLTSPSPIVCAFTSQVSPAGINVGAVTTTSIDVNSLSVPPNLTLILSGLRFRNTSTGNNSGWQQNNNPWTSAGLTPAMAYTFVAEARNGDGDITAPSPDATVHTLANIPAVDQLIATSETEIKVVLNPNGNSAQAEYLIQNTTAGTGSGWINSTSWASEGLTCETTYNFQAKARNGDGVETIFVPLGLQSTAACGGGGVDTDSDGILDADDNCTLVANADQRDTNGDGYGNVCDADLNNDGLINFVDLGILKSVFFTADPDADLNGDGSVNFIDLGMMKAAFFGVPGPSGVL